MGVEVGISLEKTYLVDNIETLFVLWNRQMGMFRQLPKSQILQLTPSYFNFKQSHKLPKDYHLTNFIITDVWLHTMFIWCCYIISFHTVSCILSNISIKTFRCNNQRHLTLRFNPCVYWYYNIKHCKGCLLHNILPVLDTTCNWMTWWTYFTVLIQPQLDIFDNKNTNNKEIVKLPVFRLKCFVRYSEKVLPLRFKTAFKRVVCIDLFIILVKCINSKAAFRIATSKLNHLNSHISMIMPILVL